MRKENRNLRKIPTSQLVKYKYYKKILHIPQCWYHHQSHARFRQADNKSTAAYTVEEASKVFFTTTVQGSCWVLSTATFCPVQILLIWTVGQRSRFVDSERLLTANVCWQQPLPKATVHLCILQKEQQEEVGWDTCLEDAGGCCAFYHSYIFFVLFNSLSFSTVLCSTCIDTVNNSCR